MKVKDSAFPPTESVFVDIVYIPLMLIHVLPRMTNLIIFITFP